MTKWWLTIANLRELFGKVCYQTSQRLAIISIIQLKFEFKTKTIMPQNFVFSVLKMFCFEVPCILKDYLSFIKPFMLSRYIHYFDIHNYVLKLINVVNIVPPLWLLNSECRYYLCKYTVPVYMCFCVYTYCILLTHCGLKIWGAGHFEEAIDWDGNKQNTILI